MTRVVSILYWKRQARNAVGLSRWILVWAAQLGLAAVIHQKLSLARDVIACCSCCMGGCAAIRLCRSLVVRNFDEVAKYAIASSKVSCVKERLVSCFPNSPFLRVVAQGSEDVQW